MRRSANQSVAFVRPSALYRSHYCVRTAREHFILIRGWLLYLFGINRAASRNLGMTSSNAVVSQMK